MAIQAYTYMFSHDNANFAGKVEAVEEDIGTGILGGNILDTGKLWGIIAIAFVMEGWNRLA